MQNGRIDVGSFEVRDTLSADFDGSGVITGFDFLFWQIGFGTAAPNAVKTDGDGDNDLDTDESDFAVWESQLGTAAPLVSEASSPRGSPSTIAAAVASESLATSLAVPQRSASTSEKFASSTKVASSSSQVPDHVVLRADGPGLGSFFSARRPELLDETFNVDRFEIEFEDAWIGLESLVSERTEFTSGLVELGGQRQTKRHAQTIDDLFASLAEEDELVPTLVTAVVEETRRHFSPPPTLLTPIHHAHNLPHPPLRNQIPPPLHARQKQNRLLDIRGQVEQVHDQCDAGAGDVAEAG